MTFRSFFYLIGSCGRLALRKKRKGRKGEGEGGLGIEKGKTVEREREREREERKGGVGKRGVDGMRKFDFGC